MRPIYIVDYAYGFDRATCSIDRVSKLRTDKAIQVFRRYKNAYIVLAADMSDVTEGCGPLAGMMRTYLTSCGIPEERIVFYPKGHNTFSETEAAYQAIQERDGGRVVAVTSSFHALRVWLIWLCRFGMYVHVFGAKHTVPRKELWIELFEKIPEDIGRSFENRFEAN